MVILNKNKRMLLTKYMHADATRIAYDYKISIGLHWFAPCCQANVGKFQSCIFCTKCL